MCCNEKGIEKEENLTSSSKGEAFSKGRKEGRKKRKI